MKNKIFKIVVICLCACLTFSVFASCAPSVPEHECTSKCSACGLCTNIDCVEDACKEKCQGHVAVHECTSKCSACGLCTDIDCVDDACKEKCQALEETDEVYTEKGIFFSSSADDGGDGTIERPYKSLTELESLILNPGSYVYLERGSQFYGSLTLENVHGTEDEPILITAYGTGDKPKIDGNDLVGGGVLNIANCSNITVKSLELFDSATTEADRRGVLVTCDNPDGKKELVTYKNITLKNLYIHDIVGFRDAQNSGMAISSKKTGGIHLWSNDGFGRVDGFNVIGCQITEVSNVGIATWYHMDGNTVNKVHPYNEEAKFKNYAHANVYVAHNQINHIGKNAIFVRHLYGGLIERNVIHDTAKYCVSGNTIVTSYVDGTVIQYNEGYRNLASPRESDGKYQDGCMLDADLESRNTIWQYNYSHDNSFGLFLNCTRSNDVVIVRYNLSVNDLGNKGIVYINYESAGIYVYNNTIVTSTETEYIIQANSGGTSFFYNNLIFNRSSSSKFSVENGSGVKASNNLVYSEFGYTIEDMDYFKSINESGIYDEDPLFINHIHDDSIRGITSLNDYKVEANSPILGVGMGLEDLQNAVDFYGNPYKVSIGCYCGD